MGSKARTQGVVLAGLLLVLAAIAWVQFGGSAERLARTPRETSARRTAEPTPAPTMAGVDVGIDRLARGAPSPVTERRNPFTFGQRLAAPPEGGGPSPGGAAAGPLPGGGAVPAGPAGPPPPQPITLKFIGMVAVPSGAGRVAVLSDGKFVYHGREGDIIDGRYRIVRIGEESVQMEHVDGRGRQTIRLTGA